MKLTIDKSALSGKLFGDNEPKITPTKGMELVKGEAKNTQNVVREEKRSAGKHFSRGAAQPSTFGLEDLDIDKEESITSSQEELARLNQEELKEK